jgi:hypothetical protein
MKAYRSDEKRLHFDNFHYYVKDTEEGLVEFGLVNYLPGGGTSVDNIWIVEDALPDLVEMLQYFANREKNNN